MKAVTDLSNRYTTHARESFGVGQSNCLRVALLREEGICFRGVEGWG
jgi:hypothetical protein